MKNFIPAFLFLLATLQSLHAQKQLPVLKSNTPSVSVKEGNSFYRDAWTISPEVKPDVFTTNPFSGTKVVTFYSDTDSLSFNVKPNKKYDFVILLNGKAKAYTQINTSLKGQPSLEPKLFYTRAKNAAHPTDTIPFTLGRDNGIHLKGRINGSDMLDFLFDTGAGACVITSSIINQKVKLTLDGTQENGGTDGVAIVDKSSANKIEINNLVWENASLLSINYQQPDFDAVLGWIAFENKIVEIDYEKKILVIHPSLPQLSNDYTQVECKLIVGVPYIKCTLMANGKQAEGWFDFDTGSDGELTVGQNFAKANKLGENMKTYGLSKSIGSTGNTVEGKVVILRKLKLGAYELYQIPLNIQTQQVAGDEHNENIGNNILKRFNAVIDFKNHNIYLKPNNLLYSPIQRN